MGNYRLINPYIEGDFENLFRGASQIDAAKNAWTGISKFFSNFVPFFPFTLENTDTGKMYNFSAKEIPDKDGYVNYKVSEMETNFTPEQENQFKNNLQKFNKDEYLQGGRKKRINLDDDDSSSDCDTDFFRKVRCNNFFTPQPLFYWWYNPLIYKLNRIYIPTFVSTISPYVHLELIDYYLI